MAESLDITFPSASKPISIQFQSESLSREVNHQCSREYCTICRHPAGGPKAIIKDKGAHPYLLNTLSDVKFVPPSEWIVHLPNTRHAAAKATQQIMRGTLNPTAFVCSSDILALGVNAGLQSIGLRMGDEIAVTGYDDEPVAEYLGLTSLRQPTDVIGAKVVDLLMAQIRKEEIAARKILTEAELVEHLRLEQTYRGLSLTTPSLRLD